MNTSYNSNVLVSLEETLDVRLISLGSRKVGHGIPQGQFTNNHYCLFSYYDTITIEKVDLSKEKENPLSIAYKHSSERDRNEGQVQCIPAFVDITADGEIGYLRTEIDSFWDNKSYPLLFMTLVNLGENETVNNAFKKVKEYFPEDRHLAYFSFDHSDLIIFCRGYSFEDYATRIFSLAYQSGLAVADTITLYSFCHSVGIANSPQIPFRAFISFGVQDYQKSERFFKQLENTGKPFKKVWLLGRNDMGVYCETATLDWLAKMRDIALQCSDKPWYTTYDLIIPLDPSKITFPFEANNNIDVSILREKMSNAYKEFESVYFEAYHRLGLKHDDIWLRWLKESSELSVSLLSSPLSNDLGLCLACQFFDFFAYGKSFFSSTYFTELEGASQKENGRAIEKKRDCLEEIEKSFSIFFADMAILIDSMNQTDRQFVQVPAFHLPSFEIPPKIMALYVTIAHRLRDVLRDDRNTIYGLVLVPKFNQNLGISSLANQTVLAEDQWLEILISEPSFYSMRRTLQAMGHEISHFVGQENRCRAKREELMMKCAFALYIVELLKALPIEICISYPCPESKNWTDLGGAYSIDDILKAAEELYNSAKQHAPNRFQKGDRRKEVVKALEELLNDFVVRHELFDTLTKELLSLERTKNAADNSVLDYLQRHIMWRYGVEFDPQELDDDFNGQTKRALNQILEYDFSSLLDSVASRFCPGAEMKNETPRDEIDVDIGWKQIRYLFSRMSEYFSETFADLQMILLFKMTWQDYYTQLMQQDQSLVSDCPLRMIAVAKALVASNVWRSDEIKGLNEPYTNLEKAVNLDILENAKELDDWGYNSVLLFYLSTYLGHCVKAIQRSFAVPEIKMKVDELRSIHKALSDQTPILALESELRSFVSDFRKDLISECTKPVF